MFCFPKQKYSEESDETNDQINKELKKEKRKLKRQTKLLLLGTGESGKSTFLKQMRIIHGGGFTDQEKREMIRNIRVDLVTSVQSLVFAMDTLGIPYCCPENMEKASLIKIMDTSTMYSFDTVYVRAIKNIWGDDGIQECYNRRREFQLSDSAEYFITRVDRVASSNYLPTEQDILRCRTKTTGIIDYLFPFDKMTFRITDVGGQRSERKKWIRCFDGVTAIIFLVAISEYDQVLEECEKTSRMKESMALFTEIIRYPWFQNTSIILFFNKTDIFDEKILHTDLVDYFPDYNGPKKEAHPAKQFLMHKFLGCNRDPDRIIYTLFTTATDTRNIDLVFNKTTQIILKSILDNS